MVVVSNGPRTMYDKTDFFSMNPMRQKVYISCSAVSFYISDSPGYLLLQSNSSWALLHLQVFFTGLDTIETG